MSIQNLKIENFRGIEFLEIEKFGKINLFVGFNNSSKTSVLESIFLISRLDRVESLLEIEDLRRAHSTHSQLDSLFYLHAPNQKLQISATLSEQARRLTLSFEKEQEMKKINYDFEVDRQQYHSEMLLKPNHQHIQSDGNFQENQVHFFVQSGYVGYNHLLLGELLAQRKKHKIIEILQQIEPNLETFEVLPDGTVHFAMKGLNQLLPFHVVGEGLQHAFSIVLAGLGWKTNMILLIDELENGLHYSNLNKIWDFLLHSSQETGSQIFITTHSQEVIQTFQEALQHSILKEDSFLYYLQQSVRDGKHRASLYPYEWVSNMLEAENELRGF